MSTKIIRLRILAALAAVVAGAVAVGSAALPTAHASMLIGVQWAASGNTALAATDIAGLVPQDNFNVLTVDQTETDLAMNDSQGNPTNITLSYDYFQNRYGTGTGTSTGNNGVLLSGDAKTTNATPQSLTFNNLAAGTYDLIVYTVNDNANYVGEYTAAGQTYYDQNQGGGAWNSSSTSTSPVWVQATGTTAASATTAANYVKFININSLAGGSITITESYVSGQPTGGSNNGVAINALQLIAIPEPSALALLAMAGMGLLLLRRRRA